MFESVWLNLQARSWSCWLQDQGLQGEGIDRRIQRWWIWMDILWRRRRTKGNTQNHLNKNSQNNLLIIYNTLYLKFVSEMGIVARTWSFDCGIWYYISYQIHEVHNCFQDRRGSCWLPTPCVWVLRNKYVHLILTLWNFF